MKIVDWFVRQTSMPSAGIAQRLLMPTFLGCLAGACVLGGSSTRPAAVVRRASSSGHPLHCLAIGEVREEVARVAASYPEQSIDARDILVCRMKRKFFLSRDLITSAGLPWCSVEDEREYRRDVERIQRGWDETDPYIAHPCSCPQVHIDKPAILRFFEVENASGRGLAGLGLLRVWLTCPERDVPGSPQPPDPGPASTPHKP